MKQWIIEDQFNELSEKQKDIWHQWCLDHKYTMKERFPFDYYKDKPDMILGFPSIGEMIEFLSEHGYNLSVDQMDKAPKSWWRVCYLEMLIDDKDDLVDGLWEATKEALKADA